MSAAGRVLVAGVGNVLRGDDGFGPAVVAALEQAGGLPEGVRTIEVGIGGIGLVHEMLDRYDALIVVDAVDRGGAPGSLYLLEPDVPELSAVPEDARAVLATDLHEAVPARVLLIARALGVLPPVVRIVGCQPAELEDFSLELTPAVAQAVGRAVGMVRGLAAELTAAAPHGAP